MFHFVQKYLISLPTDTYMYLCMYNYLNSTRARTDLDITYYF